LFSLPSDSNFDLETWLAKICELNITVVEQDLMDLRLGKLIENIVSFRYF
jgi:hypothetical protein